MYSGTRGPARSSTKKDWVRECVSCGRVDQSVDNETKKERIELQELQEAPLEVEDSCKRTTRPLEVQEG